MLAEQVQQSTLLSLSTELLLLIFDNVGTSELYSISKTSRRLHYLALPSYLSRFGISDPESKELVLRNRSMYALPGLRISLFITSLEHLSCTFWGGPVHISWQVQHLFRFISKLAGVKEVTLDLRNIDSRWAGDLAIIDSISWKPAFVRLLRMIVKRECIALTVAHGHSLTSKSPPVTSSARGHGFVHDSVSAFTDFLGFSLLGRDSMPRKALDCASTNKLQTICIHSDLLFLYPFYEWMIETLNTSKISSLSLRVSGLPMDTWATMLSSITVPTLSHFSAETFDVTLADLLMFLSRHPSINDLSLHPYFIYPRTRRLPKRFGKTLLPLLSSVSGSPRNVRNLLDRLHPLPHLHSISLSLPMHQRVFLARDFEALGREIGGVIQGTYPVILSLRFTVPFHINDMSWGGANARPNGDSLSFHGVETLNFSTDGHFVFAKWVIPALPSWLATFASLQHVSFADTCAPLEHEDRALLVHSISQSCRGIRVVTIDDQEHRIPVK